MRIVECTQGKHDWFEARCARITASEMADMLSVNSRGALAGFTSAKREELKAFLIGEILTGEPDAMGYVSKFMERGIELEPKAREAYEERFSCMVREVGFVIHPTNDRSGASPDGLIGEDGGLEIKVPGIARHIQYLEADVLPEEYEPQVMWNLACTGRTWWDFISYCDTMPYEMQIFRVRVYANAKRVAEMEDALDKFLAETDKRIEQLRAKYPPIKRTAPFIDHPEELLSDDEIDSAACFADNAELEAQ